MVHELCYGMPETAVKDPNFVCHPCRAVGTDVEVNVPSTIGGNATTTTGKEKVATMRQHRRPTECVLCTHDGGVHAMHPLLDTHGPEGRQLVWRGHREKRRKRKGEDGHDDRDDDDGREKRLAWVHTLCAAVICQHPRTRGCVYGLDANNNYSTDGYDNEEGEEEEDEEEDSDGGVDGVPGEVKGGDRDEEEEDNEDEDEDEDEEDGGSQYVAVHSYAISAEGVWAQIIQESRQLKCFVCGKKDASYRIPVQCVAGDDEEYCKWKGRHPRGTECTVAMHVGCARWGCVEAEGSHLETIDGGARRCKLCYYTPGRYDAAGGGGGDGAGGGEGRDDEDVEKETVAACYCMAHAREIVLNNPNRRDRLGKFPSSPPRGSPAILGAVSERYSPIKPIKLKKKGPKKTRPKKKGPKKKTRPKKMEKPKQSTVRQRINAKVSKKGGKSKNGATQGKSMVAFGNENDIRFPLRGRSASALAPPSVPRPPVAAPVPSGVAPKGILKNVTRGQQNSVHVRFGNSSDEEEKPSSSARQTPAARGDDAGILPELPTSGVATARGKNRPAATAPANDSSGRKEIGRKRKSERPVPDLVPSSFGNGRVKMED
ncbi:hypothetical protein ACHAW5_009236 [Stephanodiscus triporus]|uniref:PHD-type domain-containing protein n=1 Tax=Stephanodiscus triporus TaxID=2934178 RepID=A0ABD3NEK6_9STRA